MIIHNRTRASCFLLLALLCPLVLGCGTTSTVAPIPTIAGATESSVLESSTSSTVPPSASVTPLPPEPTPEATLVPPPADEVALAFLRAWEQGDYLFMYDLLSPSSWERYSEEQFVDIHRQVVEEATIQRISTRILAAYQQDTDAEVTYEVTYETGVAGEIKSRNQMPLVFQEGRWGIDWAKTLILPQLAEENIVRLTTMSPPRGNIYDRNGLGLATQGQVVEVGVVPGEIQDEAVLLENLRIILGMKRADLKEKYVDARIDWYVPLGRISAETAEAHYETLNIIPGIHLREAWARSYHPESIAPHVVGIVGPIPAEEIDFWREQGYDGDELIGQMGLERWGERYLASELGARLEILGSFGEQVALLADRPAQENQSLYTTLDRDFQKKVQDILGERRGAIAVMEANTGRVLALATYPSFDPNVFGSGIVANQWLALQADPDRPLVNRATQGIYPAGSVFKVVTTIAGMEVGGLNANSEFVCRGNWTGLGKNYPKICWARSGHGRIALHRALTVSCDITYYQVGLLLNGIDQMALPDYARSAGFGALTGIEVEESAGLVPDAIWKYQTKGEGWSPGDAVNLSIGQGELLVTPLQIASMMAAVGNGGTLYRPQLIEMIASDPKDPQSVFEAEVVGKLPVTKKHLQVIQNSLDKVTSAAHGTAYTPFKGSTVQVAGKTGTAESGRPRPHAWFAGYSPVKNPEIAIAVIVENTGEGSQFAAPLFRQVAEAYFGTGQDPAPAAETPTP